MCHEGILCCQCIQWEILDTCELKMDISYTEQKRTSVKSSGGLVCKIL